MVKNTISIRGAGIVGQVLALLLARSRISVSLAHAPPDKQPDLRSFALNAASRQILMDLRVWPEQDAKLAPVQRMQVYGDTFGELGFDAIQEPLAWIVDAGSLRERLASAISFAPEITLISELAEPMQAQLTVICEGRVSQTRDATGVIFEQFAYEQSAIAAHIVCEKPHLYTARQWMHSGQICAVLPRGQSTAGNSMALVWSVLHDKAQHLLELSDGAFSQELMDASRGQMGSMQASGVKTRWPLMLAQAQRWFGRASWGAWVLAGDAAHSVHPLAGQGLNLGLGDAVALAKGMIEKSYFRSYSDEKLLRTYERARKADAALLRLTTDGLQQIFSSGDPRLQHLRNLGMQSLQASQPLKAWLMRQASGAR